MSEITVISEVTEIVVVDSGNTTTLVVESDPIVLEIATGSMGPQGISGILPLVIKSSDFNAISNVHYFITGIYPITCTLPTDPNENDTLIITFSNNRDDNMIDSGVYGVWGPSGSAFGDVTIDLQNSSFTLQFINDTWRII